jgi:hypothetical protein
MNEASDRVNAALKRAAEPYQLILSPMEMGQIEDALHKEANRRSAIADRSKWEHVKRQHRDMATMLHDLAMRVRTRRLEIMQVD